MLVIGILVGYILRKSIGEKTIGNAEQKAKNMILDAENRAETVNEGNWCWRPRKRSPGREMIWRRRSGCGETKFRNQELQTDPERGIYRQKT